MATPILKPDPASFHEYRGTSNPELTVFGPVSSRIKLPGLRKTAFTIDGFLSPAEASGLIQEAYQPCHGGFNRACVSAENGGGSQCCGIGGSSVRTQLQPAVTDVLWSRIAPLLPLRCVFRMKLYIVCDSVRGFGTRVVVSEQLCKEFGRLRFSPWPFEIFA